jgi:DNA-binding NarL/FixJ family response regulator
VPACTCASCSGGSDGSVICATPPTRTDDRLPAAQRVRAEKPGTAVVVLSHHVNVQSAELLGERATAVGYLLKQRIADNAGFRRDLRRVAEGGVALDPEVITAMLGRRDDAVAPDVDDHRRVLAVVRYLTASG